MDWENTDIVKRSILAKAIYIFNTFLSIFQSSFRDIEKRNTYNSYGNIHTKEKQCL